MWKEGIFLFDWWWKDTTSPKEYCLCDPKPRHKLGVRHSQKSWPWFHNHGCMQDGCLLATAASSARYTVCVLSVIALNLFLCGGKNQKSRVFCLCFQRRADLYVRVWKVVKGCEIFVIKEQAVLWEMSCDLVFWAVPENRDMKKMKFSFFRQRHHCPQVLTFLWWPIEWQTFCQNSSTCYYFLWKELNFHFWFSPIFGFCPFCLLSIFVAKGLVVFIGCKFQFSRFIIFTEFRTVLIVRTLLLLWCWILFSNFYYLLLLLKFVPVLKAGVGLNFWGLDQSLKVGQENVLVWTWIRTVQNQM